MKVLFIAPLPPPIHGQSLASQMILKAIEQDHQVFIVNTSKQKPKTLFDKLFRGFQVLKIFYQVFKNRNNADKIYITISESLLGNIKDIVTYLICYSSLQKTTIHLHGGAGMALLMQRPFFRKLNHFFVAKMSHVIVLGKTHVPIFSGMIDAAKLHIVPNFAEDYLFIDSAKINDKFNDTTLIKVVYLSNLLSGKGYKELLEAVLSLPDDLKGKVKVSFAGAFGSESLKKDFLGKIYDHNSITYLGVVTGEEKKKLLEESHVFCLPTYYAYEGQPISILEAYASANVVLTTDHSGIPDIFVDNINGFQVEKGSQKSISECLKKIVGNPSLLLPIALHNRNIAQEHYRASIYNASLKRLLEL